MFSQCQGHSEVKVKNVLIGNKIQSKLILLPIMKKIHPFKRYLWSMLSFYLQGQGQQEFVEHEMPPLMTK